MKRHAWSIALAALGAYLLSGCTSVTSAGGGTRDRVGDAWFTTTTSLFGFLPVSSTVRYCYAPRRPGRALCIEPSFEDGDAPATTVGEAQAAASEAAPSDVDAPSAATAGRPATVAATPSTPRVAVVVEGALDTAEWQLAARDAVLERPVVLVAPADVAVARRELDGTTLTVSSASTLRAALAADRVLVVQTVELAEPPPEAPPPARPRRRRGHHRRREVEAVVAAPAAPRRYALTAFAVDHDGSTRDTVRSTGEPSTLRVEVGRWVRSLPSPAGARPRSATVAAVAPVAPVVPEPLVTHEPPPRGPAAARRGRFWIDVGLYVGTLRSYGNSGYPDYAPTSFDRGVYRLSPEVGFAIPVGASATLDLSAGGAFGDGPGENGAGAVVLGFTQRSRVGAGELAWGALTTLPLSALFDRVSERLEGAAAMRGLWDYWRWALDSVAAVAHGRYEQRVDRFTVAGSLAMGFLIPVGDRANVVNDTEFIAQFGLHPFVHFGDRTGVGLDLRGVWRPAYDGLFQMSLVPRVRVAVGAADLDLWLNVNLDEPLGFSFDTYRYWGLGTSLSVPI